MKIIIDLSGIKEYVRYLTIVLPIGINLIIYIILYRKIKAYCMGHTDDYLSYIKYYLYYELTEFEVYVIILDLLILVITVILTIVWAWS